jgi:hypothetical protein
MKAPSASTCALSSAWDQGVTGQRTHDEGPLASLGSIHPRTCRLRVKPSYFMISDRTVGPRFMKEALHACGDGGR